MSETLLQLTSIDKCFDGVVALREARLHVRAGEVLGLVGGHGAGKSTLIDIATGLLPADSGVILLKGEIVRFANTRQAADCGVMAVRREGVHFAQLNIAENMLLGRGLVRRAGGFIDWRKTTQEAQGLLAAAGEIVDVGQEARCLSVAGRTRAELAAAFATVPKVLFLDGPTASLTAKETGELFVRIERLKAAGSGIVLVSNCPDEILQHCDRVAIMRDGAMIESRPTAGLTAGELMSAMGGGEREVADATAGAAAGGVRACGAVSPALRAGETQDGEDRPLPRVLVRSPRIRPFILLASIGILGGAMGFAAPDVFANAHNALDILGSAAILAIMAQGAMLILCAGGIDLSVGAMMGLVGGLVSLAVKAGMPAPLSLVLAVAMGLSFSLAHGGLSVASRIHPIFVTLAGLGVYWGVLRIVPGREELVFPSESYRVLTSGQWLNLPKVCYYAVAATVLAHILLRYTLLGRQVLALGNSPRAACLIGLSRMKLTLIAFGFSGVLVGFSAVLQSAGDELQSNTDPIFALQVIAAAAIGGANLFGGRGSALGTLLGAVFVALLCNSLTLLGADPIAPSIAAGGLILVVLGADVRARRLRGHPI